MNFSDMKHSVIDWVKERRYANGPLPLIVIGVILLGCLIWIGSFFIGGDSYSMPKLVLSERESEAVRITTELHADQRFMHVTATSSPDDEGAIIVTGEVHTRADKAALDTAVKQITSTFTVTVGEVLVMESQ